MIRVPSLLFSFTTFSEFNFEGYRPLIMNMKKDVIRSFSTVSSNLVIYLLYDNARPYVARTTLQKLTDFTTSHNILLISKSLITIFSSIWTLFYAKIYSVPKEK